MRHKNVLICYDGSAASRRAIDIVARLLGRRRAVVVTVGPAVTPAESLSATVGAYPFEEANAAEARVHADEGAERARRAGLSAEARSIATSPTWLGILDLADEVDAELIVMGSRGLNGFRELLEGSTSHEVAEHSGRPVLIVPPTKIRR